jgi:hypothetical protein
MWNISRKHRYYWKVGFTTFILLLTTGSALVVGEQPTGDQTIIQTYSFDAPQIHQLTINNQVFTQITLKNTEGGFDVGEPDLPTYGVSLLLPQGSTVNTISVQPGTSIQFGTGLTVAPVEQPVILSDFVSTSPKGVENESIYSSNNVFPATLFTKVGLYSFRGYDMLMLLLYPVQYHPLSGQLSYFSDMTITVTTTQTGRVNPLFRGSENDKDEVAQKVDNVDMLSSYTAINNAPLGDAYDLLILTTDAFKDGFLPLKNAHDAQGLRTEIKTLSDISFFPTTITPDDIRDFIRKEYIANGIEYVLIGGDTDIIPAQMLWVQASGETDTMPSDLFYSCLDGTFNYNENDKYGEPHDGNGGGDVDLVGEVYVGRASVDNLTEINNFVEKTITYMNIGGYTSGTALMVGEYLWGPPDYPSLTFGDFYMDELINGSHANTYTTAGLPSDDYTFSLLYDHNWSGFDPNDPWETGWPTSEIISRINNGVQFINHLGHSSTTYNMRMTNEDVEGLTNTVLPFVYSQGCYAGAFDADDCIAESFTVKTTHAAFAVIMCARYGWGTPGSTNGPNQRYHRYFWDAVFGENITALGKANQDSKEENLRHINGPCMRWCYYEMNLFGDPSLTLISRNNTAPQKPATPTGTSSGEITQTYTFFSVSTDSDNDSLYYQWSFGDGTFSPWLGPYVSGEQVNVTHNWSKWGRYEVKVKARDEHRMDSEWSDPLPVKMPFMPTFPLIERLVQILEKLFPRIFTLLNLS